MTRKLAVPAVLVVLTVALVVIGAPGQKLSFVAKVNVAGVTDLRGDSARLLVFLDQRSTRASDGQSSVSAAQVEIGAHKRGSRWMITSLQPI